MTFGKLVLGENIFNHGKHNLGDIFIDLFREIEHSRKGSCPDGSAKLVISFGRGSIKAYGNAVECILIARSGIIDVIKRRVTVCVYTNRKVALLFYFLR